LAAKKGACLDLVLQTVQAAVGHMIVTVARLEEEEVETIMFHQELLLHHLTTTMNRHLTLLLLQRNQALLVQV
jgi:hypothetical protein